MGTAGRSIKTNMLLMESGGNRLNSSTKSTYTKSLRSAAALAQARHDSDTLLQCDLPGYAGKHNSIADTFLTSRRDPIGSLVDPSPRVLT